MIIENFLPESYKDEIYNLTTSDEFPWFYNETISGRSINEVAGFSEVQFGFSHVLFNNGQENSPFYKFFTPMVYFIEEKTGEKINELIRIRAGLNVKSSQEELVHLPHVDYPYPHKVFLYYVDDSDGDTVMYNEKYDSTFFVENFSVKETISPQRNKGILFDGLRYHSSSSPVKNTRRVAININFR